MNGDTPREAPGVRGGEAFKNKDPMAWPGFATVEQVGEWVNDSPEILIYGFAPPLHFE